MTDDRIREALNEALPPEPVDTESLTAELSERYGRRLTGHDEWPDATPGTVAGGTSAGFGFPLLAGIGAVVAGGLAGILIALSIGSPSPISAATLSLDGVPVYACPGEGQAGTLHRGDRIYIIGQADGWLAVRNVRGRGETVFVETRYVIPDEDVSGLPRRDCEPEGSLSIGDLDTTTTVPTDETTTTTVPDDTTTTTQPGATTTTTQAATTTTTAPDTTSPVIGNASANPNEIWEEDGGVISCPLGTPRQSTLSAFVTDNVGVTQVTASWTLPGNAQTTVTMTGGPTYTAQFGPFAAETLPTTAPYDHNITITIRARDAAGNEALTNVVVKMWSISQCFA
jgi:hypothetical protein